MPAPAAIRRKLGVIQQGFADALGVPLATCRNWDQGREVPDPAARSLLTIFDREPEAAMRALAPRRETPAEEVRTRTSGGIPERR